MKKVLIIDDDQFILKVYQRKFETGGVHVELASDGETALAALRAEVPAMVLLDLMLPGMNGVELLGHIRNIPGCADLPVIVFSHSYNDELIEAARAAGALQCLNKNSVSPNRLLEIVQAVLATAPHQSQSVVKATIARISSGMAAPAAGAGREELHAQLVREAGNIDARLQAQLQAFSGATGEATRVSTLVPLRESFSLLALDAHRAALDRLSLLARAVGRMLDDLREHPEDINPGTARILGRAVEVSRGLFVVRSAEAPEKPALAMVVHEQKGVAPLLADALRVTGQPAAAFHDGAMALAFVEENPVDIIVTSLEFADPAGGDLIRRMQAVPGRDSLPAVLLSNAPAGTTVIPDFLAGNQILTFPFTAEEVVVSTVIRLVSRA